MYVNNTNVNIQVIYELETLLQEFAAHRQTNILSAFPDVSYNASIWETTTANKSQAHTGA